MYIEIDAEQFRIGLYYKHDIRNGVKITRFPDGLEAACASLPEVLMILEVFGGQRWWDRHQGAITQTMADLYRPATRHAQSVRARASLPG